MLGAILAHADAIQLTADNVTLHFKEGNDTPLGPLESSKSKALLAKIATDIAAKPVTVSIETSEAGASPAPAPKPKDSPPTPKRGGATEKSLKDKVLAEPGIKKLIREFGAHVVKLKPIEPPAPLAKPATDLGPMEEG